jgi:hypothetical protein
MGTYSHKTTPRWCSRGSTPRCVPSQRNGFSIHLLGSPSCGWAAYEAKYAGLVHALIGCSRDPSRSVSSAERWRRAQPQK